MQRSILQLIVLPRLAATRQWSALSRGFPTGSKMDQPAEAVGEVSTLYVPGNMSKEGRRYDVSSRRDEPMAESSRMAQIRAAALDQKTRGTDKTPEVKQHSVKQHSVKSRMSQSDTAIAAMQKVIKLHTTHDVHHAPARPSIDTPAQPSNTSVPALAPTSTATSTPPPRPPLPPALHRLILHRQFRLAAFHLINSPVHSSDPSLICRMCDILENRGAGKLAMRLRASLDMPRKVDPTFRDGKLRLGPDVRQDGEVRSSDHWKIPVHPRSKDDPALSHLSHQQRLTQRLNAQLSYNLFKPHLSPPGPLGPLDSTGDTFKPPGPQWPAPTPRLLRLSRLLRAIERLERQHNFKPDRVTANIIVQCWLQCGLTDPSSTGDPWRIVTDRFGVETVVPKGVSPYVLESREIVMIFRIISKVMETSVMAIDQDKDQWKYGQDGNGGDADEIDWKRNVKPFCEMIKLSLRRVRDREGLTKVVEWEKGIKTRLGDIGRFRAAKRRLDKAKTPPNFSIPATPTTTTASTAEDSTTTTTTTMSEDSN